jgi:hypothetical protein
MKKRNLQRIFAAFMATAMVVGGTACSKTDEKKDDKGSSTTTTTPEPTKEEKKDDNTTTPEPTKEEKKDDNTTTPEPTVEPTAEPEPDIDLGGMEIIIRDWWSPALDADYPGEPKNDFEEARNNYRDEVMEKYNFKMREAAISDWGGACQDFVDYVTSGGDTTNYIFTLHTDASVANAMASGLMFDLSKLDCLDFSEEKFQRNKLHEQYSSGSSIYAFFPGFSEPRDGVYFNKQVLKDAGVDPNEIYDAQKNGTWTWDMFDQIMGKCQRDLDADGVDDIYGLTLNEGVMTSAAVFSNNGSYIDKTADGKYVYNLESAETLEALQWCVDMFTKYDQHDPEGANWDYYQEEWRTGKVAFLVDQEYCAAPGNLFENTDFEMGFVMFPKGPKASTYVSAWANNSYVIPACYDADRAWKIAFAWNVWTDPAPGYEDFNGYLETASNGNFDERALEETLPMMAESEHGTITFHDFVSGVELGPDLTWQIGANADVSAVVEGCRDKWKACIDDANAK